jgi:acetoin:2,6-dichlorophenolindophenol oxidoreductase subunit beta
MTTILKERPATKGVTRLSYGAALNAAQRQALELSDKVFVLGIGVDSKTGVFGTTAGLVERFGPKRVFDTPISEQAMTALAVGAANSGLRPVVVHQRLDFMLYSIDQLVNWASLWRFISGGTAKMPLTIRAIVGKGWGQGPQHSKSLHSWFAHVPGLQVVMPGSPADAKGLLLSSIMSDDPTIFIEGRSLFSMQEDVPDEPYFIRLGKAFVRRPGRDVTIVTFGSMVPPSLEAADKLAAEGVDAEVIDLRTLMPLDLDTVVASVVRTGRLVVAEPGWLRFGAGAEIVAGVVEAVGDQMKAKPRRIAWPHSYVATSSALEDDFYPTTGDIVAACKAATGGGSTA